MSLVEANGVRFAYEEMGKGPLALCLHGFPDSPRTWRHLMPALAAAGFRAVAPYMRGYAPSGLAADGDYGLRALARDAVALHEALGGDERAVVIGSDWGAEAAYAAGSIAPERWRRVVALAVPPLAADARLFSDYDQLRRFFYLFFLKTPRAEDVVAADEMAFLDRIWADWCPGYDATEDLAAVKRCLREPEHLRAAIEYYRALEPDLAGPEAATLVRRPPQPTLYLHGADDGCIGAELVGDAEDHLSPGSRAEVLDGCGHFLQVERPDEVTARIVDWVTASA